MKLSKAWLITVGSSVALVSAAAWAQSGSGGTSGTSTGTGSTSGTTGTGGSTSSTTGSGATGTGSTGLGSTGGVANPVTGQNRPLPVPSVGSGTNEGAGSGTAGVLGNTAGTNSDSNSRTRSSSSASGSTDSGSAGDATDSNGTSERGTLSASTTLKAQDFGRLDVNSSGGIDATEMRAGGQLSGRLSDMDRNGDGTLSRGEFSQGISVSPTGVDSKDASNQRGSDSDRSRSGDRDTP